MLIQDTFDRSDAIGLHGAHEVRPPRSPARLFAEAVWYLTWQLGNGTVRAAHRLLLAEAIRRERAALAGLDAAALRDIGIAPDAARREAARAFNDLPACRLAKGRTR